MGNSSIFFLLTLAVFLLAQAQAKSIEIEVNEAEKMQDIDRIGGFFTYRVLNGKIEYILLKKTDEDDWSPTKGNLDGTESEIDTAIRETREETGLVVGDYQAYIQYQIYFEYENNDNVLKRVTLWPAELTNFDKPIVLSEENEAYEWLEFGEAFTTIKEQYQAALQQADNIIRAIES